MSPLVLGDKAHVHPPGLVERSLHGTTSQNDAMTECLESHLLLTGVPTFWHGVARYPNFGGLKVIHLLSSLGQTWGAVGWVSARGFTVQKSRCQTAHTGSSPDFTSSHFSCSENSVPLGGQALAPMAWLFLVPTGRLPPSKPTSESLPIKSSHALNLPDSRKSQIPFEGSPAEARPPRQCLS